MTRELQLAIRLSVDQNERASRGVTTDGFHSCQEFLRAQVT